MRESKKVGGYHVQVCALAFADEDRKPLTSSERGRENEPQTGTFKKKGVNAMKCVLMLVWVALILVSPFNVSAQTHLYKFRVADMHPPVAKPCRLLERWGSEVERRTGGKVKFEYFWSASLIGAYEQLDAVMSGAVDISPYYSGYHPDKAPIPAMLLMPMISVGPYKAQVQAADELYRTNDQLQTEFKKNGVKYILLTHVTDCYIFSNIPIGSVTDLRNVKIRAFGPFLAFFKALGSELVSVSLPEVYDALRTGTVNGTIQYLENAIGFKHHEVSKYVNLTNLGNNMGMPAVINQKKWASLPKDIQAVMEEASRKVLMDVVAEYETEFERFMKELRKLGLKETKFSDRDITVLRKTAEESVWNPYISSLESKGIKAREVLQNYRNLLAKYSKSTK
ncbi:MAG: TRAP transporter substrate-binding protein DctP [Candidatus Bathyarchaeia archaeon]